MRVLYLTTESEDYLQDQVFIGLRNLLGKNLIDYPKKNILYKNFRKENEKIYGNGFTIWKNLDDIHIY